MPRVRMDLPRPLHVRYLDSVHAALVAGLRAAGLDGEQVVGRQAAPWTFAISGRSFRGGAIRVSGVTLSTPDPRLSEAMMRLDGTAMRHRSSNGDVVDMGGATLRSLALPLVPNQEQVAIGFASPFLLSERSDAKKAYARSLAGRDLSAAFSAGLSRRLGREVRLRVEQDRLSALTEGAEPVLVRVRRTGSRDLILPALSAVLTLNGPAADLRDAYLAGLGEKTRYGFGCPVALA